MAVIPVLNVSAVDKVIPLYNNVDKERAICVHTGRCEIEQPAPVLTPAPELQYQPPTNDSLK